MTNLLERLDSGEILFCDGAMGTFLQGKGLQPGECPELWCVDKPEAVQDIHRQYREAGSDLVETNSFGGTTYKLRHYGLADRCHEINRAAARIAREIAGDSQHVLGSAGPAGVFLQPYGEETEEALYEAFKIQVMALEEGGADVLIVETMSAVEEAAVCVRAAKENTRLTVIASFSFEPCRTGYATMMGVTPEKATEEMLQAGADVVGSNCGLGPDQMVSIVRSMRAVDSRVPIIAMPNAGLPVLEAGKTVFKETPEHMAELAPALVEAGATIIGGCCGTGPAHIAAMRRAILCR